MLRPGRLSPASFVTTVVFSLAQFAGLAYKSAELLQFQVIKRHNRTAKKFRLGVKLGPRYSEPGIIQTKAAEKHRQVVLGDLCASTVSAR